MQLIHSDTPSRYQQIQHLYLQAFPQNERKPFQLIRQKKEEGISDILSIEENGNFIGLAITINYKDRVLLDYFAIDDKIRGKGYGSAALSALTEHYKGKRMILEIESTAHQSDNMEERMRRKRFYLKNGMTELGFMAVLFGVPMEMLSNNTKVTYDEYLDLYVKTYGERMLQFILPVI